MSLVFPAVFDVRTFEYLDNVMLMSEEITGYRGTAFLCANTPDIVQ